jgi:hypothetical protein
MHIRPSGRKLTYTGITVIDVKKEYLEEEDKLNFSGMSQIFAGDRNLFIYSVDKEGEILAMNYDGISQFIDTLDKLGGRKSYSSAIIMFDGYNDVPDELHEIPEVRRFVKGMFDRFPHLLYYINFEMEGHHVLLASLLDFKQLSRGEKLSPIEMEKKYGHDFSKIPRNNMFLIMPNYVLKTMQEAIIEHGKKMKRLELGTKLAYRLGKMFNMG